MKIQCTTVYVSHSLTPSQIADRIELQAKLSLAVGGPVVLRESTAKWPLDEKQLVARLLEPDWIEYSSNNELPLEVWATKNALAIEFLDDKYKWPKVLLEESCLLSLQTITDQLARQFNSRFAVIAPSSGPGGGVAREFFAEAIQIDEIIQRLDMAVGEPLGTLTKAGLVLQAGAANLDRGYLIFIAT